MYLENIVEKEKIIEEKDKLIKENEKRDEEKPRCFLNRNKGVKSKPSYPC